MQQPGWYAPPGAGPGGPEQYAAPSDVMLEPGGFGIRAAAHIIDIIVCMVVALVAGVMGGITVAMLAAAGAVSADWAQRIGKASALTYVFSLLASLAYHALAEGLGGATAGKAICGLRVLTERREPCTLAKAIGRNLAYYIDALFFGLVGWTSMSKSPTMQRYGDKWAGTIVVHARSAQPLLTRSPVVGILLGFVAYAVIQIVAIVVKAL